jgi:hypothetical protein
MMAAEKPSLAEVAIGATDVNSLSYRELQYECKLLKLPAMGTAEVLKKRLLKAGGFINNVTPSKSKSGKFKKGGGESSITSIKSGQGNNVTPPKIKSGKVKMRGGKSSSTSIKSGQGNNSGKGVGDTGKAAKVVSLCSDDAISKSNKSKGKTSDGKGVKGLSQESSFAPPLSNGSKASYTSSVCALPLPEEKSIAMTPTASPTSGGMATTTLKVEVGISSPSSSPTAKIIAANESPGSKGRVLSAEGDEAIEDRVKGVANLTTDSVEHSDTTSRLNTDRERDHASADKDKDTAHILSPVPNANAARSKKTNEMNFKLTAASLGEEDSCNDAATNNAGPCELLPSMHHPFVEGSGT